MDLVHSATKTHAYSAFYDPQNSPPSRQRLGRASSKYTSRYHTELLEPDASTPELNATPNHAAITSKQLSAS